MWDHIVKPGESLWIISQRYHKDFNEVLRLNPQIPDKNKIFAGQVVHMPDPPPQGHFGTHEEWTGFVYKT